MEKPTVKPALKDRIISGLAIYILFFGLYGVANRLIPLDWCTDFTTSLDARIPFIPLFIYPFYLAYFILLAPAVLVSDRMLLRRGLFAFAVLVVVSCTLFIVIPAFVARPSIIPESAAGRLVASIYKNDRPSCAFPSLHVSATMLAMLLLWRERRVYGLLFLPFVLLTAAATLFVKQHALPDVAGGALLAFGIDWIVTSGRLSRAVNCLRAAMIFGGVAGEAAKHGFGGLNLLVRRTTPGGTEFDLYEPKKEKTGTTFMVVSGMTPNGERDPRIIALCKGLSNAGIRAATISLPGLKRLDFDPNDAVAVCDLAADIKSGYGPEVGIIAFSFGAGIALRAAADLAGKQDISPIILFGAYHSLSVLWPQIRKEFANPPESEAGWDEFAYVRGVLAYMAERDPGAKEALMGPLKAYCCERSLARKREFFETAVRGREARETFDDETFQRLSPAGKLERLGSRVILLHDANDRLIPPSHSRKIFEELSRRGSGRGEEILITPFLSHVTPGSYRNVKDVFRLISLLGEVYN